MVIEQPVKHQTAEGEDNDEIKSIFLKKNNNCKEVRAANS